MNPLYKIKRISTEWRHHLPFFYGTALITQESKWNRFWCPILYFQPDLETESLEIRLLSSPDKKAFVCFTVVKLRAHAVAPACL